MNDGQSEAVCPQCGSAAAVHSIDELAKLARDQSGRPQGSSPTPQAAYDQQFSYDQQASQQPGYDQQASQVGYNHPAPQTGFDQPAGFGQPTGSGQPKPFDQPAPTDFNPPPPGGFGPPPPPDHQGPPPPGYSGSAQPGQPSQSTPIGSSGPSGMPSLSRLGKEFLRGGNVAGTIEDGVADAVMGAATRFIGRKIGRRVQQVVNERVIPAMAARTDAVLRTQAAIAERHPDLRACLTDNMIFLVGGERVLPLPSLVGFTVEQSDILVARLRDG